MARLVLVYDKKTIRLFLNAGAYTMYAKFPFYSIAQLYAIGLNVPVSILLGGDNLYWVVDQNLVENYTNAGCSSINPIT
jgi:hypothetical protein